jgi:hypothetical protein
VIPRTATTGARKETRADSIDCRYTAQGVITRDGKSAVINVGEYEQGGAMKPGNTGSISYMIGGR